MPVGTLQILGSGTSAAPLDVPIAGNQLLDLVAVLADFDGSGVGVDFVPMVEIISDAGVVMAQAKGSTVLAGGSATVTFFPFGAEDTATGPPGTDLTVEGTPDIVSPTTIVLFGTAFRVLDLGLSVAEVDLVTQRPQEVVDSTIVQPNAGAALPIPFGHVSGATLLDYTNGLAPTVLIDGTYSFTAEVASNSGAFIATDFMQATIQVANASGTDLILRGDDQFPCRASTFWIQLAGICACSAGDVISGELFNGTSVNNFGFALNRMHVVRLF